MPIDRECTCVGSCKGREGLSPLWTCALDGKRGSLVSGTPGEEQKDEAKNPPDDEINDLILAVQQSGTPQISDPEQAIWDAAWALNDPDPNGQQWRRSKALKDAIDAFAEAQREPQTPSEVQPSSPQKERPLRERTRATGADGVSVSVHGDQLSHDVDR